MYKVIRCKECDAPHVVGNVKDLFKRGNVGIACELKVKLYELNQVVELARTTGVDINGLTTLSQSINTVLCSVIEKFPETREA